MARPRNRTAAVALDTLIALLLGATLAAAYAGPLHLDLFGVSLSIRTLSRPLLAAAALFLGRLALSDSPRAISGLSSLTRAGCGALIAAGVIGWFSHLSMTCGGADSYGYVSASERILAGDVVQNEPLAAVLPANGIRAATPLGYVPAARVPNASVPAYPLGLPLLMAVATVFFGRLAPFIVAPACGLALLVASYAIARTWYGDRNAALLATALVALNPLVFTYSIQAMSDVPATAAMMLAVAALSRTPSLPVLAGIAAAFCLATRPALAPAIVLLASLPFVNDRKNGVNVAVGYLALVMIGIVIQGWTQWYLYGEATASGYGRIAGLFTIATAALNARSYAHWGYLTFGPIWLAALAIGLATSRRFVRVTFAVTAVGVITPYLFYRPYDHWETLRFLLPVVVIGTIIAAAGLLGVAQRLAGAVGGFPVALAVALAITWTWMSWLTIHQVFGLREQEARHRLAGELVVQATPENAVVLALQHSGSLRYYANRQTVNWDQIPSGDFDASVRALRRRGLPVYVLIDSAEERAIFDARHGGVLEKERWLPSGQRRDIQLFEAPQP